MARICEICGKGRVIGNNVSHANNKTKRKFLPNLQNIRIMAGGTSKRIRACTRCIRSRLIQKQIRKSLSA